MLPNTSHYSPPDYSNHTRFGITSPTERHLCIAYLTLVLLSSLLGDTLVLVGSIKYRALQLQKFLVGVIEHIAVGNLVVTLCHVSTSLVALVADGWVLGSFFCYLRVYTVYWAYTATLFFVATLTLSKLLFLKFPFTSSRWTKHRAHLVCGVVWGLSAVLQGPLPFYILGKDDIAIDYRIYSCVYQATNPVWVWLKPLSSVLFMFLPNLAVVINAILLLYQTYCIAQRAKKKGIGGQRCSIKWTGLIVVILSAIVQCISVFPITISIFLDRLQPAGSDGHVKLYRAGAFCAALNIMMNFFIYSLAVRSFRSFLLYQVLRRTRSPRTNKMGLLATSRGSTVTRSLTGFQSLGDLQLITMSRTISSVVSPTTDAILKCKG